MVDEKTYGMTTYARLCKYLTPQPTECHTTIHQCSQPTHTHSHTWLSLKVWLTLNSYVLPSIRLPCRLDGLHVDDEPSEAYTWEEQPLALLVGCGTSTASGTILMQQSNAKHTHASCHLHRHNIMACCVCVRICVCVCVCVWRRHMSMKSMMLSKGILPSCGRDMSSSMMSTAL